MKLVKSLLLGSAAGLCAVAGAQAADLPVRHAAPVEYVRVCSAHGAGFFYIPGSDTCLRIGGRVRFSYQYMSSRQLGPKINGVTSTPSLVNGDNSAFQSLVYINMDARTSTAYGTLRTFIRVAAAYTTGGFLTSGSSQRYGQSYPGLGNDAFGVAQTTVYVDKAFIQWAGFTAGRAGSFFDFYAHDLEHFAATSGSDVSNTNLLAYTATFGGGWSATISIEDPLSRRQPLYTNQTFASTGAGSPFASSSNAGLTTVGGTFTQSVVIPGTVGSAGGIVANYDVRQRELVPDVVGVIRYDAPWGAAQVSAAMHELRGGNLVNVQGFTYANGLVTPGGTGNNFTTAGVVATAATVPDKIKAEMGWAIQGGLKVNLPQLAVGDVLWLQAAYSQGALNYSGTRFYGTENVAVPISGRFVASTVDSYIGSDFKQKLTDSWSVTAALLHYWTPEWRSAFFGSYAEVNFGGGARGGVSGPANLQFQPGNALVGATYLQGQATLKDYSVSVIGANVIWSPIKDLDIGLEGVYTRVDLKGGGVADLSKGSVMLNPANQLVYAGTLAPAKIVKYDDVWSLRMRVQRDF